MRVVAAVDGETAEIRRLVGALGRKGHAEGSLVSGVPLGRLPIDEQVGALCTALACNEARVHLVRPNPVLAPRGVYETKTRRWREQRPGLTVLPWPAPVAASG